MNIVKTTLLLALAAILVSCDDAETDTADKATDVKPATKTQVEDSYRHPSQPHHEEFKSHQKRGGVGHGRHTQESIHNKHAKHAVGEYGKKQRQGHHVENKQASSHHQRSDPSGKQVAEITEKDPLKIFKRRILPIMQSKRSSSCTECHLSGVELKQFILSDQSKTFASLRQRGLIDEKNPDDSKILKFIARKPSKPNPITEKVRKEELAAFRTWIRAAVKNPRLLKAAAGKDVVGLKLPPEVIRHARKDRVLTSFVDNVWSQMGRCINCHSPNRNRRLVKKHGDSVSWIVPRNPQATLQELLDGGNIDLKSPDKSPVLLKPAGQIDHGGGPKFRVGGPTYRNFRSFLRDYAAIVNGKYKSADDLPTPNPELVLLAKQHLRIVGIPAKYDKLPLQVDLFRWNSEQKRWSKDRWGTAFNPIKGKRHMWQSMISLTAPSSSKRAKTIRQKHERLPDGAYLARIYIDRKQKTVKDPDYRLGQAQFVGQVEIRGRWPIGYRPPKIVRFPDSDSSLGR